jgi:hypothetical protein
MAIPMVERDVMLRAMEHYVSQDDMRLHIRNQQALARAALGNHSVLEQADAFYRQQAQLAAPQRPAFQPQPDYQAQRRLETAKQEALLEGLVCKDREGLPETWYCPTCAIAVHEAKLDEHISSGKHQGMKELSARRITSWAPYQPRADMPVWMEIRNDQEFCTLCNNYVTPEHIESDKHQKRLLWHLAPPTSTVATASPTYGEAPKLSAEPPPEWGDPDHFEWKADRQQFYCKLCWKFADDNHVIGLNHTRRVSYQPESFALAPAKGDPPPPPPRGGHEPVRDIPQETPMAALTDLRQLPRKTPFVEWKTVHSKEHDRCFFYHCETQVSQWEKPDAVYNGDF